MEKLGISLRVFFFPMLADDTVHLVTVEFVLNGETKAHDPTFVTIPATGKGKNKRVGMCYVICKKCGSMAMTAKKLAMIACEQYASSKGPKRQQLVERLRACLDNKDIGDELKKGARTVLNIIDSGAGCSTDTATEHASDRSHCVACQFFGSFCLCALQALCVQH